MAGLEGDDLTTAMLKRKDHPNRVENVTNDDNSVAEEQVESTSQ